MSQSTFTHQYRLLVCNNCGASLSLGAEASQVTCRYCGAASTFRPRAELQDMAALRAAPANDEYERFQRLKAQEDRMMLPPTGLDHLVVAGGVPPQLIAQAQGEWQAMLREISAGAPVGVHEKFFYLTFVLAQALNRGGGEDADARRRGMIETAIEVLEAPPLRYRLRAQLARDAVRQGDLASAQAWLSGCDSRSYDLEVDSDYRLGVAFIASARGDFAEVLRVLGQREGDVPVAHSSRGLVGFLRANALERSGRVPEAIAQLRAILKDDDVERLLRIQRMNASLRLCEGSVGALIAEQNQRDAPGAPAEKKSKGFGSPVAIPFVLIGGAMLVAAFFVDPKSRTDDGLMPLNLFLGLMGGFFAISGAGSGLLVRKLTASAGLGGASREGWKKASGRIVSVNPTGWTINDQPQLSLRLQVFYEEHPIYEVDTKICVPPHQVGELKPGVSLSIRVDPQNPQNVSASG